MVEVVGICLLCFDGGTWSVFIVLIIWLDLGNSDLIDFILFLILLLNLDLYWMFAGLIDLWC